MKINGITISEDKLAKMSNIISKESLRDMYVFQGMSDIEIADRVGLTQSWVNKLRKVYGLKTDERYQLRRNPLRHISLSERQKEILYGSLLGDSCIAVQNSGTGYWSCRHSVSQEGYLLKVAEEMKPFVAKVYYGERAFEKGGELFSYVDARSFALPQFTAFRNELYPEGKKRATKTWLEKLTPAGLAYWYMDDGSTTGYGFDITTYDPLFKDPEVKDILRDILKLSVSVRWSGDEGKIHVLKESHVTAWEYIESEIVPCLSHKVPFRFRSKDNQQPSQDGNVLEGSTTGGSLNSTEYGDNTRFEEVIFQGTPGIGQKPNGDTV